MDITQTQIIDSNIITNSDTSKILLMDNLIEHFAPLFYEDLRKKQKQQKSNESDVKKLMLIIDRNKKILITTQNALQIESIKNEILKEIERLNSIDVLYGKNRITIQSIISALDTYTLENLKKRLALLRKLVKNKRG